jgi:uncharacterized membrane protein HdeD (DUF308 family)
MARIQDPELDYMRAQWRMLLAIGAASIVLGTLMVMAAPITTLVVVVALGALVVGGGVIQFMEAFTVHGWSRVGHMLLALLYAFIGASIIAHPATAALSLTVLAGVLLIAGGAMRIYGALSRRAPHREWVVFSGILSALLGGLVLWSWPVSGFQLIGTFVGVDLLFHGWSTVLWASAARSAPAGPPAEPPNGLHEAFEREPASRH